MSSRKVLKFSGQKPAKVSSTVPFLKEHISKVSLQGCMDLAIYVFFIQAFEVSYFSCWPMQGVIHLTLHLAALCVGLL